MRMFVKSSSSKACLVTVNSLKKDIFKDVWRMILFFNYKFKLFSVSQDKNETVNVVKSVVQSQLDIFIDRSIKD